MQNRNSRSLLFGARPPASSDSKAAASTENMESDNQMAIDQLRGSAGTIKDIAIQIDSSVNDQNRMLDMMDKRFETGSSLISSTLKGLNEMVNDRTSSKMCVLIAAFFVALLLIYRFLIKN